MSELLVGLKERSYPILIEAGYLKKIGVDLRKRKIAKRFGVVADDRVAELYGDLLMNTLDEAGLEAELLTFPQGEASKNLGTLGDLASKLATLGFDRKDGLIGFGGGVTGDLTGFLASSYMRGVEFVQIPTTLLAQVDSSVGGKTGVDIPEGKNLVGAFYQPKAVYIDPEVLKTLPKEELLGGMAEVIKHGVIRDEEYFEFLKTNRKPILQLEPGVLVKMIHTSCSIKAGVVSEDEREGGIRKILNYGHTIGHAVEAASDYTIIHGLAVSVGMVAAAKLAVMNGLLTESAKERIISLLKEYSMPTQVPGDLDKSRIKKYLLTDKKAIGGKVYYVLPVRIGGTKITAEVTEEQVDTVLA